MKHRLCPIPCAACETRAMELWLEDMAAKGWSLTEDSLWLNFARFEKTEPRSLRVRLRASIEKPSLFSDSMGEPDGEERDFAASLGWEYVARWGDFFIYRTADPDAVELETDEEVRKIALRSVRKRMIGDAISLFIYFLLLVFLRLGNIRTMLDRGSGLVFAGLLLFGLFVVESVLKAVRLSRAVRREAEVKTPSVRRGRWLFFLRAGLWVLILLWFAVLLCRWSDSVTNKNRVPLGEYTAPLPFAVIGDFFPEGDLRRGYPDFNYIEDGSDLLTSRVINYQETSDVQLPDGSTFSGGMGADYYVLRSEFLAKWLYKELAREARREKHFSPLAIPALRAEESMAYTGALHFPTLLLRQGNVVLRVMLYKSGEQTLLPLADWTVAEDAALSGE